MVMVDTRDGWDGWDSWDKWDKWDKWDSQLFSGIRVDRGGKMSKNVVLKKLWQR